MELVRRSLSRVRPSQNSGTGAERASIVVEVAIFAPLAILAVVFMAWVGSQRSAEASAMAAARAAARAAAIAGDPAAATAAAVAAGSAATEGYGCSDITISIDTSQWDQGWVVATAACLPEQAASTLSSDPVSREWIESVGPRGRIGR